MQIRDIAFRLIMFAGIVYWYIDLPAGEMVYSILGGLIKGVAAAFTQGKRNKAAKASQKAFDKDLAGIKNFQFQNHFSNIKGQGLQGAQLGDAAQQQVATLGDAAQAQVAELGKAQGYDAQGYESQGYDAERAEAAQAAKTQLGEDTGRTNQFAALQVNTAAADRQAQETDEALAASQEAALLTGGGGATALAQAAAKAKQGVADSISQQEAQNEQLRAQGATSIQQENLAQRNTARQANIQQDQFNTGLDQQTRLANQAAANQAAQFGAAAANQAAQFGASAQNEAARFGAQASNQFALSKFGAQNQANLANAASQNQFAQAQFGAQNAANANNAASQNQFALQQAQLNQQANQFTSQQDFQAQQLAAQGAQAQEQNRYGQQGTLLNISAAQNQAAQAEKQQGISDIVGGVASAGKLLFSDKRLKENIKSHGISPSGLPIYTWNYIGSDITYEGAIAQEVPEEARVIDPETGYYRVDYSKIDIELKIVE